MAQMVRRTPLLHSLSAVSQAAEVAGLKSSMASAKKTRKNALRAQPSPGIAKGEEEAAVRKAAWEADKAARDAAAAKEAAGKAKAAEEAASKAAREAAAKEAAAKEAASKTAREADKGELSRSCRNSSRTTPRCRCEVSLRL